VFYETTGFPESFCVIDGGVDLGGIPCVAPLVVPDPASFKKRNAVKKLKILD
jgi:hypothetical protein